MLNRPGKAVVLMLILHAAVPAHAEAAAQEAFIQWARGAAIPLSTVERNGESQDLEPLGEMIGDAALVALSEGVHAGAEPLEFRNRLFEYLVRKKGYTAIAIESGLVESRGVHEYVKSGSGNLSAVLQQGLSWTFDRLPQNEALIRWMVEYNADPNVTRKLDFYGFDVPGSPGNPMANRGTETALREVLAYLDRVDPPAAAAFHSRLDSLVPRIHFDPMRPETPGYQGLSSAERDAVTAGIADLIALIERKQAVYVAATSARDYEWAHRAAIGARQVDGWLRQIPLDWKPPLDPTALWPRIATDVRDRAQADNIDWIVRQEGAGGKILLFASRYHVSTAPLAAHDASSDRAAAPIQQVAGTYLRRRYGSGLVTIGNLIRAGAFGCAGWGMSLSPAPRATIDGLAGELNMPLFLLDLRTAPPAVAGWLNQQQQLGQEQRLSLPVGQAFDLLLYMDTVTPACAE